MGCNRLPVVHSVTLVPVAVFFPGQLAAGTCEIVTLDRDSSQPRRTIARQTARCACKKGQIAGTTRARPACVDGKKRKSIQFLPMQEWCLMKKNKTKKLYRRNFPVVPLPKAIA